MENRTFRTIGILFIVSTILCDLIFTTESTLVFTTTAAFLLGVINVMAINYIRVIFKISLEDIEEGTIAFGPAFDYKKEKAGFMLFTKGLTITLKE